MSELLPVIDLIDSGIIDITGRCKLISDCLLMFLPLTLDVFLPFRFLLIAILEMFDILFISAKMVKASLSFLIKYLFSG